MCLETHILFLICPVSLDFVPTVFPFHILIPVFMYLVYFITDPCISAT